MRKLRKLERALIDGEWFDFKSTKVFADIAIGVGLAATAAAGIYATSTQAGIANRGLDLADDTQFKQDTYNAQLMQLMANPGQFLSNPLFKSTLDVGLQGVNRSMQASGYKGSGNQATALEQYGQSFASSQLFQQEQLLGGLSGASLNPAGGLQVASNAASSAAGSLNSLAGMAAFSGTSGIFGGGGASFADDSSVGSGVIPAV